MLGQVGDARKDDSLEALRQLGLLSIGCHRPVGHDDVAVRKRQTEGVDVVNVIRRPTVRRVAVIRRLQAYGHVETGHGIECAASLVRPREDGLQSRTAFADTSEERLVYLVEYLSRRNDVSNAAATPLGVAIETGDLFKLLFGSSTCSLERLRRIPAKRAQLGLLISTWAVQHLPVQMQLCPREE